MAQARDWRQRALRGEKDARGLAHELECEVRRRFPRNNAPHALPPIQLLGAVPQTPQRRLEALVSTGSKAARPHDCATADRR